LTLGSTIRPILKRIVVGRCAKVWSIPGRRHVFASKHTAGKLLRKKCQRKQTSHALPEPRAASLDIDSEGNGFRN
jgi:hypothetical protein